jgi:hypothetical protein
MTDIGVDLMTDVGWSAGDKVVKTVHLVCYESSGIAVICDGRVADGLTFGEMLEQVVSLTIRPSRIPPYRMLTRDELAAAASKHQQIIATRLAK